MAYAHSQAKARVALFRHKHEVETGRTSSVGMEVSDSDAFVFHS
jgi:GTPase